MECHFSILEMLNTILDGPGLKTSSLWFATSECAKYQDLKKRKKNGAAPCRRMKIPITNVTDEVLTEIKVSDENYICD